MAIEYLKTFTEEQRLTAGGISRAETVEIGHMLRAWRTAGNEEIIKLQYYDQRTPASFLWDAPVVDWNASVLENDARWVAE